jgi:hypothetical protein
VGIRGDLERMENTKITYSSPESEHRFLTLREKIILKGLSRGARGEYLNLKTINRMLTKTTKDISLLR